MSFLRKLPALGLLAVMATGCFRQVPENPTLADADDFTDSLAIAVGNRLGLMANFDLVNNVPDSVDKKEMLRAAMMVLETDTANMSFIYGLTMGQMLLMNYKDLAASENIDKELYINAAKAAFMLDSLPSEAEVEQILAQVNELQKRAKERASERADREIFATEAARLNRELGDAVAEKLLADGAYKPVASTGMLISVATPGDDNPLGRGDYAVVDLTLNRIDSGIEIASVQNRVVAVGNPNDPVLSSVLPYLSIGETATLFLPYGCAYGVAGEPKLKVGPCESVMATITLRPFSR